MILPAVFCNRMKKMLGDEYAAFLAEAEEPAFHGIRLNPLKCAEETLRKSLPFSLSCEPTPFSPLSFYAPAAEKCGSLAAHHAGMFYVQEPSAASAVTLLDPKPGEKILDLCAAPGGKSTQIAAFTKDTGLLWSNEIVRSRAEILSGNLERLGVKNAVISSCRPDALAAVLPEYFDRVLVDAPCSGEGMFRRDETAIGEWTEAAPAACAARQREILDSAAQLLKVGGVMVYSTCTFSREENEETIASFLARHPEFESVPCDDVTFGRPAYDGICARRIFPMDGGEGHFAAKLQKKSGTNHDAVPLFKYPKCDMKKEAEALWNECFSDTPNGVFCRFGNTVSVLPKDLPAMGKLNIVRAGYDFAQLVGSRLVPCHGAYLCHRAADCRQTIDFDAEGKPLLSFLRGEEIPCAASRSGWCAVTVFGVVTGFGKASGGRLKNKYPKGLRLKT